MSKKNLLERWKKEGKKESTMKSFSLRLHYETCQQLDEICKSVDLPPTRILRDIVTEYIRDTYTQLQKEVEKKTQKEMQIKTS